MKPILLKLYGLKKALFLFVIALVVSLTVFAQAPANDDCSGAVVLVSGTSCVNTGGTLFNATTSVGVPAGVCGLALSPDVWYSFVAKSVYPNITLSSVSGFSSVIQLVGGTCASQTQLACVTGTSLNVNAVYPTD